ncbi:extensin-like, partial [Callorhinchus milii]|uniref:extensin-like n=1 Tax=Callorhinchus milii TaxID=7868 RepID=UPI001C3F80F2
MEASKASGQALPLVQVEFNYEYTARDGRLITIRENERYHLLSRTTQHWWHVRKDQETKPFYVPANYVKELPGSGLQCVNGSAVTGSREEISPGLSESEPRLPEMHSSSAPAPSPEVEKNTPAHSPAESQCGQGYAVNPPGRASTPQTRTQTPDGAPASGEENCPPAAMIPSDLGPILASATKIPKGQSSTLRLSSKGKTNRVQRLSLTERFCPPVALGSQEPGHSLRPTKANSQTDMVNSTQHGTCSPSTDHMGVTLPSPKTSPTQLLPQTPDFGSENIYETIPDLPLAKAAAPLELVPTHTPSHTPKHTPSHTPTHTPSHTPTHTPRPTLSPKPTLSPSHAPSPTRSPKPTLSPIHIPSDTPIYSPVHKASHTSTPSPTLSPKPTLSPVH